MCRVLQVSRSGYYKWRSQKPSVRRSTDAVLMRVIRDVHYESRGRYGSPRVHRELHARGIACGRGRVARLMRQVHLRGIAARRRRPRMPAVDRSALPNLLQRNFSPGPLNRVWTADMTYIRTAEGWLFLAIVLDVGSRRVVGWAMGNRPDTDLTLEALDMAILHRQPAAGLLHHTDRGVHYTNARYRKFLRAHGIRASYSGLGNCWDNAVTESFFHTLKTEESHAAHYKTRAEARKRLFEFIEVWYNRKRRHTALGHLSPTEFERRL
jgi:putative transposase